MISVYYTSHQSTYFQDASKCYHSFPNEADRAIEASSSYIHHHHREVVSHSNSFELSTSSPTLALTSHSDPESPASYSPRSGKYNNKPTLVYTLDVLRLDPSKSSLGHLASSLTFVNQADDVVDHRFPSHTAPLASNARVACCRKCSSPIAPPWVYTFPIHLSPDRVAVRIDDNNLNHRINLNSASEGEVKLRKHVCPFCTMRFKRPSGLKTHLNSHTGATRKSSDALSDYNVSNFTFQHFVALIHNVGVNSASDPTC